MLHQAPLINNLFPECRGRRFLLIGIGGGGDIVGALPTHFELQRAGAMPQVGGLTWKRTEHDPKGLPRRISEFENIKPVNSFIGLSNPETRLKEGTVHIEANVSSSLGGEEVVSVDISEGVKVLRSCLKSFAISEQITAIVAVDVGGDALCKGNEATIRSPLCDQVMMAALSGIPNSYLAVIGLGADGELPLEQFYRRFDELAECGAYKGALAIDPDDIPRLRNILSVAKSESSNYPVSIAESLSSERLMEIHSELNSRRPDLRKIVDLVEQVKVRNGTRVGELSCLSAFTLIFDLQKVYDSSLFPCFMDESADIFELNEILTREGYVTEITDKAREL